MQRAMGWQERSVRGLLAGRVKKMPGISLTSEKPENGPRRYRVVRAGELQRLISALGLPSDYVRKGLLLLRGGYVRELTAASYPLRWR